MRRSRAWAARIGLLLGSLVLCEALLRGSLVAAFEVPWSRPSALRYHYYPTLRAAEDVSFPEPERTVDVLLLGASALNPAYGSVPEALGETLRTELGRRVRLHNLSAPAHTTRDSMIKLRFLRGRPYDAILVYHGINDVRANNAPPDVFDEDYDHYSWYAEVNALWRHPHMDRLVAPFLVDWLVQRAEKELAPERYVPTHRPRERWLEYGARVRTGPSFRENLASVLEMAAAEGTPVVGATFAYYVPEDYSLERFRARALDFAFQRRSLPIELWGRAANVVRGIQVHNRVLRELAASRPGAFALVDVQGALPKDGARFIDVCHLTRRGSADFARLLLPALRDALRDAGGDAPR